MYRNGAAGVQVAFRNEIVRKEKPFATIGKLLSQKVFSLVCTANLLYNNNSNGFAVFGGAMNNLSDIRVIKSLLARHGFQFSKALGQNFLTDPAVCPKMAKECGADATVGVLEIGPGFGVLTRELAVRAKKVVAVELDKRLPAVLAETLCDFDNVKVVQADIMQVDLHRLLAEEFAGQKVVVCANLPYYITSPVIMRLLEERLPIEALTVMVQKEAAERICAAPGSRACGAVSVAVQYYSVPQMLFEVPRTCFFPEPKVDSAVIRLQIRTEPPTQLYTDEKQFFRLIRAAFGQRRKTVLNALSAGLGLSKQQLLPALQQAGILPTARAEQLKMEQFGALCNALFAERKT